jgi:curli production assembly/transport component CsgF
MRFAMDRGEAMTYHTSGLILALAAAGAMVSAGSAGADDLVYRPINPSFGGNPLNSNHLLSIAGAQRTATARDAPDDDDNGGFRGRPGEEDTGPTNAEIFLQQLESRLFSALAGQVTESIFGENPQDSGRVIFGTTTVEFTRSLESITLTIADSLDGTLTEIVVPTLIVE